MSTCAAKPNLYFWYFQKLWGWLNAGATDLGRQVTAVAGGEFLKRLCTDVAAPKWFRGDNMVQGREGLFHGCTDGGGIITQLKG